LRASSVSSAYFWKSLPACVIDTFPPERSNSLAPTSSSSARICAEIAGCVRKRFSAAREKLERRATSRKVSSWSKSIIELSAFSCQLSALRYFRRKTCVQNKIGKGTNLFVPPMLLHPCPSERARPRGIRFPTFLFVLALPFPAICLLNQEPEAFVIALIKTINFPLPRVGNTLKRPAKGKI